MVNIKLRIIQIQAVYKLIKYKDLGQISFNLKNFNKLITPLLLALISK
jgi:hypothetical protein